MTKFLTTLLILSALASSLSADDGVAGFCRLSGTPVEDVLTWDDAARFTDIDFQASVPFSGELVATAGNILSFKGAFWQINEFVYEAGTQSQHFYLEFQTGAAAGQRFEITANTGSELTIDLAGGTLGPVAAGDEVRVVAHWSLDTLFPAGKWLTASTDSLSGSEVSLPVDDSGTVDFSTAQTFEYRSDLGFLD